MNSNGLVERATEIKWIKYTYQNFIGVRCSKLVPLSRYLASFKSEHVRFAFNGLYIPSTDSSAMIGKLIFDELWSEVKLVPRHETLRKHPYHPGVGIVQTKILDKDGQPFMKCPYHLLERAVSALKELGYTLKLGFELEFQVFKAHALESIENNGYASSNSLDILLDDFMAIEKNLNDLGVELELFHKEAGQG